MRCAKCGSISISLPGGKWLTGCQCKTMFEILGWVPDDVLVVVGEKPDNAGSGKEVQHGQG